MTHAYSHAVALAALVAILAKPSSAVAAIPPDAMTRQQALERFRSGQQLLLTDAFAAAAAEFQAAIDLDPGMALAHYGLGQSYMGLKSYEQAVQAFTRCREAYAELSASTVDRNVRMNQWVEDEIRGLRDTRFQLDDPAARERAVDRLAPWGGTALHDVVLRSLDLLDRQRGRRALVLFTDGEDRSSHARQGYRATPRSTTR